MAPPPPSASPPSEPPSAPPVEPPSDPQRAKSLVPALAEPSPPKITFAVDPIADGSIILLAGGFAGLLDLINSTGEVRPQQIAKDFDRSHLLTIDRGAVSQTPDSNASRNSNIGLGVVILYALVDPILSGVREESVQSGIADGILYLQTAAVTWGVTNLAKIAVRRPRPIAYIDAEAHKNDPSYSNSDTDSSLSFFSGHASIAASLTATATYLAFARSPRTARPWITLVVGTAITSFVAVERVRSGAHFPTDVIAGSIAGAGVGIVVPHIHRSEDVKQRRVWVGYAPAALGTGGGVQLSGIF